jgi:hypothetical protein
VWAVRTSQETHHVSATEPNRLMLCGETVAVCCENHTEHTDTLWADRTTQETHHVSTTEPNRLMLCGETVAVGCDNRTEHRYTLWAVRTSQETHHVSTTEPNRLMLCWLRWCVLLPLCSKDLSKHRRNIQSERPILATCSLERAKEDQTVADRDSSH